MNHPGWPESDMGPSWGDLYWRVREQQMNDRDKKAMPDSACMPEAPNRDPLLTEREKTHGSFAKNAQISSALKVIFREEDDKIFSAVHREALDMIALKLSRILSGQANFKDHWRDLSGYSLLAMEACDEDKK